MKKTLMACAAVLAVGGAIAAENNVTIYGVADIYAGRTSSYAYTGYDLLATGAGGQIGAFQAARTNQMVIDSGGLTRSRIGLRVNEDLGAGKTGFVVVESGLNLDTGTGSGSRTTVVGLKSAVGTFSVGRQASPYHDAFSALSAQNDSRFDAAKGHPMSIGDINAIAALRTYVNLPANIGLNPATDLAYQGLLARALTAANTVTGATGAWSGYKERISNSVRYDSPDFNGFSGSAVIGLGENRAPGQKASFDAGFNVNYANGPMALTLAHQTEGNQLPAGSVIPAGSVVKLTNTLVGGVYDFGVAKLHAGFNVAKYNFTGAKTQKELLIGASMPVGATTVVAQYARSHGSNTTQSFGVEAHYALSKRSTAYAAFNSTKLPAYKNSAIGAGLRHVF